MGVVVGVEGISVGLSVGLAEDSVVAVAAAGVDVAAVEDISVEVGEATLVAFCVPVDGEQADSNNI